jgi:hypothetical protein
VLYITFYITKRMGLVRPCVHLRLQRKNLVGMYMCLDIDYGMDGGIMRFQRVVRSIKGLLHICFLVLNTSIVLLYFFNGCVK